MLYSDLLKRQEEEASRLNFEYRESRDQIKQMQPDHFEGGKYEQDLKRLDEAFKRDFKALHKQHQQEKKNFLNEPERAEDKPRAKDMDTAYNKTVTVEMGGVKPETKEQRIECKMQEWEDSQQSKTKKQHLSQGE